MAHRKTEAQIQARLRELEREYPDPDNMSADEARTMLYRAFVGEIPEGHVAVVGACGDPVCVNPAHTCIVPDESAN